MCVCSLSPEHKSAVCIIFSDHNCVSLKTYGRAEMLCKVEELRREMESRLDSQRRHMVQKESQLKNEVEELKVTCHTQNIRYRIINFYT